MVTGETIVGHGYSGNFLWDFEEGESEYTYFVPDEGGTIWVDGMAVLAQTLPTSVHGLRLHELPA